MIGSAIGHIKDQLNQYLRNSFEIGEDVAILSHVQQQDGSPVNGIDNKVLLFLVNVEKDTVASRPGSSGSFGFSSSVVGREPVFLNLYLMVAANFTDYSESLKFLSNAAAFFQRTPVLDHQNTPDMDRRLSKLALDIENLNLQDLSALWGVLGGKYLPSILYRVRTVMVDSEDVSGIVSAVREAAPSIYK